jgi:aquaporin Z
MNILKTHWQSALAEFWGTALLITIGISAVILNFGAGSPVKVIIPDPCLRRLITGFLFGSTGAAIAVSRLGKISGAHINPVVSLAFYISGKLRISTTIIYIISQLSGGIIGAVPLLLWGHTGESIDYGATLPGKGFNFLQATAGEVITTFFLITGLYIFIGHKRLRNFTPLLFPFLYAIMVYLEAPISGTSTNPARSLGPLIISGNHTGWWIYWIGPFIGMVVAVFFHKYALFRYFKIEIAKLYHFEHNPHGLFSFTRSKNQGKAEHKDIDRKNL